MILESLTSLLATVSGFPGTKDPHPLTHIIIQGGEPAKLVTMAAGVNPVRPKLIEIRHDGFVYSFTDPKLAAEKFLSLTQYKPL